MIEIVSNFCWIQKREWQKFRWREEIQSPMWEILSIKPSQNLHALYVLWDRSWKRSKLSRYGMCQRLFFKLLRRILSHSLRNKYKDILNTLKRVRVLKSKDCRSIVTSHTKYFQSSHKDNIFQNCKESTKESVKLTRKLGFQRPLPKTSIWEDELYTF